MNDVLHERLIALRDRSLLQTTDIDLAAAKEISAALTAVLADVFTLYIKTKNFHWHMSGRQFRDLHLATDEQADQLSAMTDSIAERCRKIRGTTLRSVSHIRRLARISDNDADFVTPDDMLSELWEDNKSLVLSLPNAYVLCDSAGDIASARLLENWIDEGQRRAWFLFEMSRN